MQALKRIYPRERCPYCHRAVTTFPGPRRLHMKTQHPDSVRQSRHAAMQLRTADAKPDGWLSIFEFRRLLPPECNTSYVRINRLCLEGKLRAVRYPPGTRTPWYIDPRELERFTPPDAAPE